ncbi:hypothetical protein HA402_005932 [Bradysia odoriphaga]|nr:hypothetical protein HA402_005932 [Bradysia odoriphaga]
MEPKTLLPVVVLLLLNVIGTESYKILGIFHTSSKSHYIAGGALMRGLAEKGHDVTVISPFPQIEPLKNFHDIPIIGMENLVEGRLGSHNLIYET